MFTKQLGEEEFCILGPDGEESEIVLYGAVAVLKIEEAVYYAEAEGPDDGSPVMSVQSIRPMPTTAEEVEWAPDDEDSEDNEAPAVEIQAGETGGAPEVVA